MLLNYIIAMGVAVLAIVLAVILGDYGPWYLSWFLGTGFMMLVAAAAGILFEAQESDAQEAEALKVASSEVDGAAAGPSRN